jgi:hypothetical protein
MKPYATWALVTSLVLSASSAVAQDTSPAPPSPRMPQHGGPAMMAMMDSLDRRLDSLVGRMNRATGNQKVSAMAVVINEMVAQRRVMQQHMRAMMDGRGMPMMMPDPRRRPPADTGRGTPQ